MSERDPEAAPEPDGATGTGAGRDEQDHVARLLAAAASSAPELPDDVADRLDATLARLVAERGDASTGPTGSDPSPGSAGGGGGVVDLGARRRRRWAGLLVAAATVSVVGLGVGTVLETGAGGDAASTDAGSVADEGVAGGEAEPQAEPQAGSDVAGTTDERAAQPDDSGAKSRAQTPAPEALTADARPPRLSTSSLVPDAQRIEDFALTAPAPTPRLDRRCVDTGTTSGDTWLRIRLDGRPAVLVLRAPYGGRRTAEVFTCEDPRTPAATARIDEH